MGIITVKPVLIEDMPLWLELSEEYDCYVRESVPDLTQWYNGNETDISFSTYMRVKISQNEAFMASDKINNCFGIVAFSMKNNRITFFGISHKADFNKVGEALLNYALSHLDCTKEISITVLQSNTVHISKQRDLVYRYGFKYIESIFENGVPVDKMVRGLG